MKKKKTLAQILYEMDWIVVVQEAIELRPEAWADYPVKSYKNAGDSLRNALMFQLKRKGYTPEITFFSV